MNHLFEFLLRQGDNTLVLGHRLSEWCGRGPALEEDIALANTALDLIGQTQLWLGLAADVENKTRDANALAYLRDAWDFRNLIMLEYPNRDYGHTLLRQYLFDAFQVPWLTQLKQSSNTPVSEIAEKSLSEALYHLERSQETVIALGDGTEVSNQRMQNSLNRLWPFAGEMFHSDATDEAMAAQAIAPNPASLKPAWEAHVENTMRNAKLTIPASSFSHSGGRDGKQHSEHLGHLLATMQYLQRAYPGATW